MNLRSVLERIGLRAKPEPRTAERATSTSRTSGVVARPTYATTLFGNSLLPRETSFTLLRQFHRSVPVMGQAIKILSGFVGYPNVISENEALAEEANQWMRTVSFGNVGFGLGPWIKDHLGQALLYGYGVGELVPNARRDDVERLWSYLSPSFGFRTNAAGEFQTVQNTGFATEVVMDPQTLLLTVPESEGCSPNGQSLFFACPTFAQGWLDITHAYRSMVKRNGIPTFHVNWSPPEGFEDPTGSIAESIRAAMETAWNDAMKSQVVDGVAMDFFTTGDTTITVIGADAQSFDITLSKRAMVEEIVAATGIPAWMLGYSWSTTERLSTQQADMLLATVDNLRRAVTPAIEKILRTRMLLAARDSQWELDWQDVNLQDRLQTAQADLADANASAVKQKVGRQLWADGVWTQAQYAEEMTGSEEVAVAMEEPPVMAVAPAADTGGGSSDTGNGTRIVSPSVLRALEFESSLPPLRVHLEEYAERWPVGCNGKH